MRVRSGSVAKVMIIFGGLLLAAMQSLSPVQSYAQQPDTSVVTPESRQQLDTLQIEPIQTDTVGAALTDTSEEETAPTDVDRTIALAVSVVGEVDKRPMRGTWTELLFGGTVQDSSYVRTGERSFCALAFVDDGSQLKLREKTKVFIRAAQEVDYSLSKKILIDLGKVLSQIHKMKGSFEVRTPTAVATVTGTSFWTMVDSSGNTDFYVLDGEIEINGIAADTLLNITEGLQATLTAEGTVTVSTFDPATLPSGDIQPEPEPEEQDEPQGGAPGGEEQGQAEETGEVDVPVTPTLPPEEPGEDTPESTVPSTETAPVPTGGEQFREGDDGEPGSTFGIHMNAAVGASVFGGQTYQMISLRPELSIGKLGIGFDLPFYFDQDGELRDDEWDEPEDIIDKFYYVRWAQPGDPFYVRGGALEDVTFGYGLITRRYTNALEWPEVRRVGLTSQFGTRAVRAEVMTGSLREIDNPGVVGGRLSVETNVLPIPVVFGGTVMHDGNQFLGARDDDEDGVPNGVDQFPGSNDSDRIGFLRGVLDPDQVDQLIDSGDLPDINNPPQRISEIDTADVTIVGFDIGLPLFRGKLTSLWLYGQAAKIIDHGMGIGAPGLRFKFGPFRAGAEYRMFEEEFVPEFFNMSYEIERVQLVEGIDGDQYYQIKSAQLKGVPSSYGFFADAGLLIYNFLDVYAAYQNMTYDDALPGDGSVQFDPDNLPNQTLYARAAINPAMIPKVGLAEAYYHQPRAEKLFTLEADGTTLGYRIGFELSQNVMLVVNNATIYRNTEDVHVMTVETVLRF